LYSATKVIMHWKAEKWFGKTHRTAVHFKTNARTVHSKKSLLVSAAYPSHLLSLISLAPSESDADVSLTP
jgi:hypothetical protein